MSGSHTVSSGQNVDYLTTLAIETLHFILDELDDERDQVNLAMSCKWLYRVYRIYHLGFATPKWVPFNGEGSADDESNEGPPAASYRDGVLVDGALCVPILNEEQPVCWVLDFKQFVNKWHKSNIILRLDDQEYIPLRNTVATFVRSCIYLFGGETVSGNPSNIFYELDPKTMVLRNIKPTNGIVPSMRTMHSLNTVGKQHLVLFGGRSVIFGDIISGHGVETKNNNKYYDTKDFYLYDLLSKTWYSYPDEYRYDLPYARSAHSSLSIGSSLYIYGGQKIRANAQTEIHDDEDLWVFNFDNTITSSINSDSDSAEEVEGSESGNDDSNSSSRSNTTTSTTSMVKATSSNMIRNFLQNRWQKLFSPRTSTSPFFALGDESDWKETTGKVTGKRCGSAMFRIGKRVAILGGYEKDNWVHEEDAVRPWEMCKLYLSERRRWDHIRITGFPEMECVAFTQDHTGQPGNLFIMGRKKDQDDKIVMGWIKDY
ncbi:4207_t:CDS:2 [Ambispora leptoticha]|uniref:4207_t:CDS:1 n=1 Tax=Ambispora leptoticha TaxID=144679 RepID=A0A9N8VUM1_9GLOM|nr:4207_t:CDS:2 [Ambispora leptoticha]